MSLLLFSFLTGLGWASLLIPPLIRIGHRKNLCAPPTARGSHRQNTPALGGVALYFSLILSALLWMPGNGLSRLRYMLAGLTLLFLMGAGDDVRPMRAGTKLVVQCLVAAGLLWASDIGLRHGHGLLGWGDLPAGWLHFYSLLGLVLCFNAMNLIDGIDGLAAGIGIIIHGMWGVWFGLAGDWPLAVLALAIAGGLMAFLYFNASPARIFLGDSGSLLLGGSCGLLLFEFLRVNSSLSPDSFIRMEAAPAVAAGMLFYPWFDTLRVFFTRLCRGISPFRPDRRHIHHMLIDLGLTHMEATALLVALHTGIILLVFGLQAWVEMHLLLAMLAGAALAGTYTLHLAVARRKARLRSASFSGKRLQA